MITQELVAQLRLVCPESRTPLTLADVELVDRLNQAVVAGTLSDLAGNVIERRLEGALVREDGRWAYPIFDGIPKLIVEGAIDLAQIHEANDE